MPRKFAIGDQLYGFTANDNEGEVSNRCVISSHGLRHDDRFDVPGGMKIIFYVDLGYALNDPGIGEMLRLQFVPTESYGQGTSCHEYTITKYQGYHGSGLGNMPFLWTLKKLELNAKRLFGRPEDNEADQETYDGILRTLGSQKDDMDTTIEKLKQLIAKAEGNLRDASQMEEEELRKLGASKGKLMEEPMKRLETYHSLIAPLQTGGYPDLITVRKRVFSGDLKLSSAVRALKAVGYKEVHCSFCRGSLSDIFGARLRGRVQDQNAKPWTKPKGF